MKKLVLFLFSGIFSISYSQNPSWIEKATSSLQLDSARASYVYVCDLNNDNYPEIITVYASLIKGKVKIYFNIPDPMDPRKRIFKDSTEWSNIDIRRNGQHGRVVDNIAFADIDNDGDVDAVTGIYYHRWEYYHPDSNDPGDRCEVLLNRGDGKFSLVENSGLNTLGPHTGKDQGLVNITGITFLDYDKDGKIDLFLASWFDDYKLNQEQGGLNGMTSSYLLKGNGDGTFTDQSFISKISLNKMPLYGSNATDWNNDGWMDIATAPYCRSGGSLYANQKNGKFNDVAFGTGYNTQHLNGDQGQALCCWETQPADYDNDGDIDFFYLLVHGGFGDGEGSSTLVINKGPAEDYHLEWALEKVKRDPPRPSHLGDYSGNWLDLDNDMLLDMVMGSGGYSSNRRLFVLRQDTSGLLDDISLELGITSATTMIREIGSLQPFDYDLDGDDDLLIAHGDGTYQPKGQLDVYENKIGSQNNWIGIRLFAPENCNQSAVGSRIIVWAGGVRQMREIKAGYGHFAGQQPFITNFGLGNNSKVDSVVVEWQTQPATRTVVTSIPINQVSIINKDGYWGSLGTKINFKTEDELKIWPNPATTILNIYLPIVSAEIKYKISDIQGKTVAEGTCFNYIDISAIEKGLYLLMIENEGKHYNKKFVIFR
ncbi:MAG TPA: FG-GAP-like repeat-containing protein [Bacteroidia bacterium]|nr:FG-GAP-like repeat-containing protein [Bacteroidia bacterium]HRS59807.1 FG-GAP-like repeat-containing protein [Bacteroidia bacterium]